MNRWQMQQLLGLLDEQENLMFPDIQARGMYPAFFRKRVERNGCNLPILPGDLKIMRENTVDFVTFSYYNPKTVSAESALEKPKETCSTVSKILTSALRNGAGSLPPLIWYPPGRVKWKSATALPM